jgi:hypothetical protein
MHETVLTPGPAGLDLARANGKDPLLRAVRKKLFSISPAEVTTTRRRFHVDSQEKQERIEAIGSYFLKGYHAAIACDSLEQLHQTLGNEPLEYQGFAYEGAAMGVGLLDRLMPWQNPKFPQFLESDGNPYPYLSHVGLGWALARIPGGIRLFSRQLLTPATIDTQASSWHSLLSCLVLDGFGFHQAFFRWESYVRAMDQPNLHLECLKVFDQGLGRGLCFVLGMDGKRIGQQVQQFPPSRQADLWSGVGLAAAYAGGLSRMEVDHLKQQACQHLPAFAQGVAFAAKARQRASHIPEQTQLACACVWNQPVEQIAKITDDTIVGLHPSSKLSAYATWRERIQRVFVSSLPT